MVSDVWDGVSDWQPRNVLTMCILKCLCSGGVCNQGKRMCWVQGTLMWLHSSCHAGWGARAHQQ